MAMIYGVAINDVVISHLDETPSVSVNNEC